MVSFEFEEVARCGSSHGVNGGIKFAGEEDALERCLSLGYVFVLMEDGSPVPFKIRSVDQKSSFILFFDTIDSPEEAKRLSDRPILLPIGSESKNLMDSDASDSWGKDFVGFELFDKESGRIARIVDVMQYPGQVMAEMEEGELIPLHDDLILKIEPENKKITVSLASGIWSQGPDSLK